MWPRLKWPRSQGPVYASVQDDDSESQLSNSETEKFLPTSPTEDPQCHRVRHARDAILSVAGLVSLWIVLVAAWRYTLHPVALTLQYEKQTLTCGTTVAEAEANGCVFDILSHYWMPVQCMDYVIRDEYREYLWNPERLVRQFPYFYDDEDHTWLRNEHTLARSLHKLIYTTQEEHLAHCDYLLQRIHRAANGHAKLDGLVAGLAHTQHCINELRDPRYAVNSGNLSVAFYISFSNCTVDVPVGTH